MQAVVATGGDQLLRVLRRDIPLPDGATAPDGWNGPLLLRLPAAATIFTLDGNGTFIGIAEAAGTSDRPPAKKARTDGDQPDGESNRLAAVALWRRAAMPPCNR